MIFDITRSRRSSAATRLRRLRSLGLGVVALALVLAGSVHAASPARTRLAPRAAAPAPAPAALQGGCTPGNILQDPGLEASTGTSVITNPFWASTSTNFTTSLCSAAVCGTGGGSAGPRAGAFWTWFGGVGTAAETGTLSQSVVIPAGATATLNFWLRIGAVGTPFTDVLNVKVDGATQTTITEPSVAEASYTLRTVDLSAFADGASHTILFEYIHPAASGTANFNVDDITLDIVCSGPALPRDSVGVVDMNSCFFLRNTNDSGNADVIACFGTMGTVPLSGDWNGDDVDTVGVYNATTSTFFLKNTSAGGDADVAVSFGLPSANLVPITGDWDGDGDDTIGLYDSSNGTFFLKNTNAPGDADLTFVFGVGGAGIFPITGDWDNNGTDTIGLYNPAAGTVFLRNSNTSGNADVTFFYGGMNANLRAVTGDWDSNGSDTVGIFDPAVAAFFLRNSNSNGPADITFFYGAAGQTPVSGNWDGMPSSIPKTGPTVDEPEIAVEGEYRESL